jgi:hypothetical protein
LVALTLYGSTLFVAPLQGKVEAAIVADGLEYDGSKKQSYQFTRQGYFCVDKVGGRDAARRVLLNMNDVDCMVAYSERDLSVI